jgi:hypothetical protein
MLTHREHFLNPEKHPSFGAETQLSCGFRASLKVMLTHREHFLRRHRGQNFAARNLMHWYPGADPLYRPQISQSFDLDLTESSKSRWQEYFFVSVLSPTTEILT